MADKQFIGRVYDHPTFDGVQEIELTDDEMKELLARFLVRNDKGRNVTRLVVKRGRDSGKPYMEIDTYRLNKIRERAENPQSQTPQPAPPPMPAAPPAHVVTEDPDDNIPF